MSLTIDRFSEFFGALYKNKDGSPQTPFPWQSRLAKLVYAEGWPDCIDLPTASGKTTSIDIAVFVLACQAAKETKERNVGRRIFFAVNRRVIVDEAFNRATALAKALINAEDDGDTGILGEVARALRSINGESNPALAPPLDVAELRGGIYRDRAWARSITQPVVVCTTADQLGSRLLFRGYGVTVSSAPIHAALCGCDSLVLLDEAHVTRAFSQTMQLLTRYQSQHSTAPKMRFVQMTATPEAGAARRFILDAADLSNPVLKDRQDAKKPATLHKPLGKKESLAGKIAETAIAALPKLQSKAIGIIVNRVQTARDIEKLLRDKIASQDKDDIAHEAKVHLVIGRMRPIDRDHLQEELRELVGPDRPRILDKPVFIVATQCLEVGADYDFDVIITECSSIDALRQRMGRLNRKGRPISAQAHIFLKEESLKEDDPIYGTAMKSTWEWLTESNREAIDFGIVEFKKLWDQVEEPKRQEMMAPAPNAAILLPAHLDSLCQTNPQPVPSPDVSYFIHGPQRDNAEVSVCWRADLHRDDSNNWPDIVRLLPPTSIECMTVPLRAVHRWMKEVSTLDDRDADVPVLAEAEDRRSETVEIAQPRILVWRGTKYVEVIDNVRQLRPNDTLVMPVEYRNWSVFGHVPNATPASYQAVSDEAPSDHAARCRRLDRSIDVAEQATRDSKLRVVIRIHPAFEGNDPFRGLLDSELREKLIERNVIKPEWNKSPVVRIERHPYIEDEDENPDSKPDQVVILKRLLEPPNKLVLPTVDEEDGADELSEANRFISLDLHTKHVVDRLESVINQLQLNGVESAVRASAPLHDIGKADVRFQAMLAGISPYEAMMRPSLLGKGDGKRRTLAEQKAIFERAMYPRGFRHEMLSVELIEHLNLEAHLPHRDLLLHLIAAHHGYARPFAPVCFDDAEDAELRSVRVNASEVDGGVRKKWIPSHRLDSGIAERFWKLTREHGWWGLAWLESILRLADQQASAAEQEGDHE